MFYASVINNYDGHTANPTMNHYNNYIIYDQKWYTWIIDIVIILPSHILLTLGVSLLIRYVGCG